MLVRRQMRLVRSRTSRICFYFVRDTKTKNNRSGSVFFNLEFPKLKNLGPLGSACELGTYARCRSQKLGGGGL